MASTLIVEILEDGSLKLNASKMIGEESDLLEALQDLATAAGGDLNVEKHVEGAHHHHHGDGKWHTHAKGGK